MGNESTSRIAICGRTTGVAGRGVRSRTLAEGARARLHRSARDRSRPGGHRKRPVAGPSRICANPVDWPEGAPPSYFARSTKLPSRVSNTIFVPMSQKRGTWTSKPESSLAGLVDLPEV